MAKPVRPGPPFNPFAWGTLFFTFWLTLITIPNIGTPQTVIAWVFFGLSCFLWLATFIPPLDKPIGAPITQQTILPWVFLVSVFVWVVGSVTALPRVPESIQIIVPVGTLLWLVAYMSIFIWGFKHARLGTWMGIVISAFFVLTGITYFFKTPSPIEPWNLIAIGAFLLLMTLLKSKIGRKFPLI